MIIRINIFMIEKMVNGLATFIVTEGLPKQQKEIYTKGRFIYQDRNGIAARF